MPDNQEQDNVDIFLEHYGVKGMKWGVRKQYHRVAAASNRRKARVNRADAQTFKSLKLKKAGGALGKLSRKQFAKAKEHDKKVAEAQKKIDAIKKEKPPKRKPMDANQRAKIEMGAALVGVTLGAGLAIASFKFGNTASVGSGAAGKAASPYTVTKPIIPLLTSGG